jgi:hypothetical protein
MYPLRERIALRRRNGWKKHDFLRMLVSICSGTYYFLKAHITGVEISKTGDLIAYVQ